MFYLLKGDYNPLPETSHAYTRTRGSNLSFLEQNPGLMKQAIQENATQTLRVQLPNNHILTRNLQYNYYYTKPKYLLLGNLDPLGSLSSI